MAGDWAAVLRALRQLSRRRREATVLRPHVGLSELGTAALMNVSVGSVKGYASRGLAELAMKLEGMP